MKAFQLSQEVSELCNFMLNAAYLTQFFPGDKNPKGITGTESMPTYHIRQNVQNKAQSPVCPVL